MRFQGVGSSDHHNRLHHGQGGGGLSRNSPPTPNSALRSLVSCSLATLTICVGAAVGLFLLLGITQMDSSPDSGTSNPAITFLEKVGMPKLGPRPLPDSKQQKCQAASKALRARGGWDYMRVLRQGEGVKASIVNMGDLDRLHQGIARANQGKRPLRIGVLGGSFSAGGAVTDMSDSFPEVLRALLSGNDTDAGEGKVYPSPLIHGAEVINMAQGGAGFMLPLFCTEKVYSMVADDSTFVPDVWLVEFGENFDATLDQYEALLAMLMWDKERFGHPAVITAAVAKNFCWWSDGSVRRNNCGLHRTWKWLLEAAETLHLPLISFVHGVAPWTDYIAPPNNTTLTLPDLLIYNESDIHSKDYPGGTLWNSLDKVVKQLYADCGENQHFNEYGHRLMGHFLYGIFTEAARISVGDRTEETFDSSPAGRNALLPGALDMVKRITSGSTGHTLSCNLTLTQGRALDLTPIATMNYTLWAEKAEGSKNIFSAGKKRADRKQTWTPKSENSTIDFEFKISKGASTLCVLMYGAHGMFLEASFPGYPTKTVAVTNDNNEITGCKAVKMHYEKLGGGPKGGLNCTSAEVKNANRPKLEEGTGKPLVLPINSTCIYPGGVDWTPYSVYKLACGCGLPQSIADGEVHRIHIKNKRGLVQIAGVVIW